MPCRTPDIRGLLLRFDDDDDDDVGDGDKTAAGGDGGQ